MHSRFISNKKTKQKSSIYLHSAERVGVAVGNVADASVAHHRVTGPELLRNGVLDAVLHFLLQQELSVRHAIAHLHKQTNKKKRTSKITTSRKAKTITTP